MTALQLAIYNQIKLYNKSKTGPYIAYHYKDDLLITCFTEADRVREVVYSLEDVDTFINKVRGVL